MQSMPQVQAAAEIGCTHQPNNRPVATTSSMTTNDAESRVCAYWRSSSRSKAGRVPDVDVSRSRASRTRCCAALRWIAGTGADGSAGSSTISGLSAGLLMKQHKSCPRGRTGFLHCYNWLEILKRDLREPNISV